MHSRRTRVLVMVDELVMRSMWYGEGMETQDADAPGLCIALK